MGKKETEQMLGITMDFLSRLTTKQFQELVNGNAVIRYEANGDHTKAYEQVMEKIKQTAMVEKHMKNYTKKELLSFCRYFKIDIKSRDTKNVIFQKIAVHVNLGDSKSTPKAVNYKQLETALHNCNTIKEANELLRNENLLLLKKDITAFARELGVYVNQKYTKQELTERIVDSVVGARIRGKLIRMED
ncbi:hypothetical protein ACFQ3N_13705 [Virgibacillus byunsanensis]|uniref:Rho termination factor N-terminal domain-containing protein n=1 Tax=Virgibacillus byunsanensis TaxID=570945 RepID=A0ABW3LNC9_9BACI